MAEFVARRNFQYDDPARYQGAGARYLHDHLHMRGPPVSSDADIAAAETLQSALLKNFHEYLQWREERLGHTSGGTACELGFGSRL